MNTKKQELENQAFDYYFQISSELIYDKMPSKAHETIGGKEEAVIMKLINLITQNLGEMGSNSLVKSIALFILYTSYKAALYKIAEILKNKIIKDPLSPKLSSAPEKAYIRPLKESSEEIDYIEIDWKNMPEIKKPEWWASRLLEEYRSRKVRSRQNISKITPYLFILAILHAYLNGDISLEEIKKFLGENFKFIKKFLIRLKKRFKKGFKKGFKKIRMNFLMNCIKILNYLKLILLNQLLNFLVDNSLQQLILGIFFEEMTKVEKLNREEFLRIFLRINNLLTSLHLPIEEKLKILSFLETFGVDLYEALQLKYL